MLNLRYFLDPRFGVAAGVITLVFFGMFGFFFLLTQYFQLVLGYGTLEAGVKQLPFAAVMMLVAPNSPKFAARWGTNVAVATGLIGMSAGMFLFTIARSNTPYIQIVLVVMVMAAGMATCIPSMTGSIMSAVPLGKAGVGSAMNDTTRELGGALGVAVLGSLVASRYDARLTPALDLLPASLQGQAGESLAGALHAGSQLGGPEGTQVASIAREAFISGMHLAAIIAGCVTLLAAAIVYRKLPAGNPHAIGAASVGRPSSPDLAVEH
jgi:Na+/melibiose symporter-like transporter